MVITDDTLVMIHNLWVMAILFKTHGHTYKTRTYMICISYESEF